MRQIIYLDFFYENVILIVLTIQKHIFTKITFKKNI
jgi:hypothetical protein